MPAPNPPPEPGRRLDDPAWVDDIVASAASRVAQTPPRRRRDLGRVAAGGNGDRPPTRTATPTRKTAAPVLDLTGDEPVTDLSGDPSGRPTAPAVDAAIEPSPADGEVTLAGPPTPTRHARRSLVEWSIVAGVVLVVAVLIRMFVFQAFSIPSASMTATLQEGDVVAVSLRSYDLGDVGRGDIVIFDGPDGADVGGSAGGDDTLIKRVVGLPNESIEIENSMVVVNGIPLEEPYVDPGVSYPDMAAVIVPDDHVFVLGDNRPDSRDSRTYGAVPIDDIEGRAVARIWPPSRLGPL